MQNLLLKPMAIILPPALKISISAFYIHVFRMILGVNSDYFLRRH
jgi:hypothetical protein